MGEFLVIMRRDFPVGVKPASNDDWRTYVKSLEAAGCLRGGSSFGEASTMCADSRVPSPLQLGGFLKLAAQSIDVARALCATNPDYLAGASIDIFPLLED